MLRRSYTTVFQLFAFFAAIICIEHDDILKSCRHFGRDAYQGSLFLPSLPEIDSERCPSTPASNPPHAARFTRPQKTSNRALINFVSSTLLVGSIWVAFTVINFSESLLTHQGPVNAAPVLDLAYTTPVSTEIVISMYKEPVDSITSLVSTLRKLPSLSNSRVHIYTKDKDGDISAIRHQTGAHSVTRLRNVGREGETYLYHILSQWDSLSRHTLFIQGSVHNQRDFFSRVHNFFDPDRTGMLNLGFSGHLCKCGNCGDEWDWKDTAKLIPQLFSRVYNSSACSDVLLSYKGQFIASAKRIRGLNRAVYEELQAALVDERSWAHQEKFLDGRQDSMSAPDLGYTLERLWNVLLQCSDLAVAWKCPSLLSGKRWGGSMRDCQCLDN
ncbi:uncharacterized protein BDZ99DRAFT_377977 [Mytilinidion resinicola]|uniref:Uncharacterized protein n=1 Tax=Mytilinidion resinicola TaxID=574789 RepID=A0A6A6Z0L6_9PEZI|nr:uncharacterized protein BDZ99DRAFT_377977 [Mytilinidion resinicola]KAF2814631.1 hypothetical protein BDZ99DRAFT_377977 [Mytilinidion resinicola]